MTLESGAPRSSKTYWLIVIVVTLGVAGWFLLDWSSGYAEKNASEARKRLGLSDDQPLDLSATFTETEFREIQKSKPTRVEQVTAELGRPFRIEPAAEGTASVLYVSQYGMVALVVTRDRITSMVWQDWKYTRSQIEAQLYWACAVGLFTLFAISKAYKTCALRVTLDDSGMTYGGQRIAYGDMTEFTGFNSKGWVFLNHDSGGATQKFRLDNQRVDKYEEIILAICDKTDLQSPLPKAETNDDADDSSVTDDAE